MVAQYLNKQGQYLMTTLLADTDLEQTDGQTSIRTAYS